MKASKRVCSFPGCGRPFRAQGVCAKHYSQIRQGKELKPLPADAKRDGRTCKTPGCERHVECREMCWGCWRKTRKREMAARNLEERVRAEIADELAEPLPAPDPPVRQPTAREPAPPPDPRRSIVGRLALPPRPKIGGASRPMSYRPSPLAARGSDWFGAEVLEPR